MPAILIENTYMIYPEQEVLLKSPAFLRKIAWSIADGIMEVFDVKPKRKKVYK